MSIVYNVWKKILLLMDNSLFFRFVDGCMLFLQKLFSKSALSRFLSTQQQIDTLNQSLLVRLYYGFFHLLAKLREGFFEKALPGSVVVAFLKSFVSRLLGTKLLFVGITMLFSSMLYRFLADKLTDAASMSTVFLAIGLLCLLIKGTVGELMAGSFIFQKVPLPPKTAVKNDPWLLVFYLAVGAVVAVLFAYIPFLYALAALFILPAGIGFLCFPWMGIVAIVAAAPFLPTMVMAAMVGGIFVLMLLSFCLSKRYAAFLDLTGVWILIFILVSVFCACMSFAPTESLKVAALTSLFMLAYLLVIILIDTKEKMEAIIFTFITSGALVGLYGLYQKVSGRVDMTWVDKELFEDLRLRVYSTFGNPNVYGEYLLLIIPIAVAMVFCARAYLLKIYYLGITALLLVNLALTYSRGCYIALALAAFVFVLFVNKRLVTFFSVGVFALPIILPDSIVNRFLSIADTSDSSTSYRIYIWQGTIRMLQDFWFCGVGQGTDAYNSIYPLYALSAITAPHSHNVFLQVFVETGLIGFLVFLFILACFFKQQISFVFHTTSLQHKIFASAAIAAVLGFLIQGVFDYVFYNNKVFLIFFMTLALANAYMRLHTKEDRL